MVLRSVSPALVGRRALPGWQSMTAAQAKPLTVEDIYSYEGWTRFNGSQAAMMTWVPAGDPWLSDTDHCGRSERGSSSAEPKRRAGRGCAWMRRPARAGRSTPTRSSSARSPAQASASAEARNASRACAIDLQRSARRLPHRDWRRPLRLQHLDADSDAADRTLPAPNSRRRSAPTAAASRSSRTTIFSSRRIGATGERALTSDGSATAAERHARLGVFRRALRSRQSPRLLVEPRLVPHRVSAIRRTRGPGIHADR